MQIHFLMVLPQKSIENIKFSCGDVYRKQLFLNSDPYDSRKQYVSWYGNIDQLQEHDGWNEAL